MDLDRPIDFKLLGDAIGYYEQEGYKNTLTNWSVLKSTTDITFKSDEVFRDNINDKIWVGSAEQGFIELMLQGKIKPGKYQSTTPCFRNELLIDKFHKQYFMKTELINILEDDDYEIKLEEIIHSAYNFFSSYLDKQYLKIIEVPQDSSISNYDIEYKGIELGSYGFRVYKHIKWIYGTGCAEQRLTYCR